MPARERLTHGIQPRRDARFAVVDLLTATHEADHHCPVSMAVKIRNEKLWLGLGETRSLLSPEHEVCGLPEVPRSLRFVEDDDVIARRLLVPQPVVPKVMHVLDERLHRLPHDAPPCAVASSAKARDLIARQRLPQHRHQRAVTGEEHSMRRLRVIALLGGHIQAHQRLARAGHAGDEHNDLSTLESRRVDEFLNALGRDSQIASAGIMAGNCLDRMLRVKRLRRLDDGRGRLIR